MHQLVFAVQFLVFNETARLDEKLLQDLRQQSVRALWKWISIENLLNKTFVTAHVTCEGCMCELVSQALQKLLA